jgi:hypothetical protein
MEVPAETVLKQIVDAASDSGRRHHRSRSRGLCRSRLLRYRQGRHRAGSGDADDQEQSSTRAVAAEARRGPPRRAGSPDFIDVVVHVFVDEKREFYGLERLWGDAPDVELLGTTDARSRPARRRPSASR